MKIKIKKICKNCGITFYVLPCRKEQIFCSMKCYGKYTKKNRRYQDSRKIITCLQCGKEFKAYLSQRRKFCSLSCASTYNQKNGSWNKGIPHTDKTKKKISNGVKESRPKNWINPSTRKEVKEKISQTMLKRGTSKGKNNSMYGYKRTFEQRKAQSIKMSDIPEEEWNGFSKKCKRRCNKLLMNEWRLGTFERDNYTCQNPNCPYCHNKIGGKLEAHHIKPWRKYPELRYNINNGITLCKAFHRHTIHNEYKYEKLFTELIRK